MTQVEATVIDAWQRAASDLGIQVSAPYVVTTPDGVPVEAIGLVHQFGGAIATLLSVLGEPSSRMTMPEMDGYYRSELEPNSYSEYRRQHFVDALNDWGYVGSERDRPAWYSGRSWS